MTGRILVVVLHLKDRYMGRERGPIIGRGHNDARSLDLAQFMPRFVMDCCGVAALHAASCVPPSGDGATNYERTNELAS